jgi:hypothetical protein
MPGFILLTMMGCRAFIGCAGDLPSDPVDDKPEPIDTGPVETDSGDTAPVDTGPPPLCEWPEEEPNSTAGQAQPLPLETWACGTLETQGDFDVFRFSIEQPGWVKVWVRGQDLGTSSNLQLTLDDAAYDYTTLVTSSPDSLDPVLLFPVYEPITLYATIADQFYGYGEDYIWQLIASEAKAPVLWTASEVEPNDGIQDGLLINSTDRIFGIIDAGSDADWFTFEVPQGAESQISAHIEAWNYGSPINARITLYDGSESRVASSNMGENSYDLDPQMTYSVSAEDASEDTTWGIKVAPREGSGGGLAYWYVLEVTVETDGSEDSGL